MSISAISSGIYPNFQSSFNSLPETRKNQHGVDYRDSKSFNDFMKNDNLKNEIEKSLSIQV